MNKAQGPALSGFNRIGDALIAQGLLSQERLDEALELQRGWGSRLGDILLAKGWVRPQAFYNALATHFDRPFINLLETPPDFALIEHRHVTRYLELLMLPWRREGERTIIAIADPSVEATDFAQQLYGSNIDFVITSKFDIIWMLQRNANEFLNEMSVSGLAQRRPDQSAIEVFTTPQLLVIGVVASLLLLAGTIWPIATLVALNMVFALLLLGNFGFRALLIWIAGERRIDIKVTPEMVSTLQDQDLPTYTILVPMYKEPDTLPILAAALRRMDYPLSKLDIKLILEDDDDETINSAKQLGLEGIFEIIRVPHSLPKTKPKACNYALHFARGEYVTIYDAEDKPEPDQLKRVLCAFHEAPENTVCIQARLNYFNSHENWLTRMFTLEYSLWFDFYLPALEALRIPIPLGGTSNHFRMSVLREVDAWDPYNVTEDADLGIRVTQRGYRVGVVNSTTYEEANTHVGNWIRQRSRWIKGYMQTYLVHMRRPIDTYRKLGHAGFWGFQFFIGGTIFSALIVPWLLGMYVFWLVTMTQAMNVIFPPLVQYISLINLLLGNGLFIYITALGAFKRQLFGLIPYALTVPAYWFLMSIAAYKGLWQLIHNPFFWEKTQHGLSTFEHTDLELEPEGEARP